jgi:hypothetical protein
MYNLFASLSIILLWQNEKNHNKKRSLFLPASLPSSLLIKVLDDVRMTKLLENVDLSDHLMLLPL